LGQALGIGVLAASSLDVLAAGALEVAAPGRAERVAAVVDARRGEVFAAAYAFGVPGPGEVPDPAAVRDDRPGALDPGDLGQWLEAVARSGPVLVVGGGAVRYLDLLAPRPGLDLDLAGTVSAPTPAVLARLAARRLDAGAVPVPAHDVVPDYRRAADARINWEVRAPHRTAEAPRDTAR